MQGAIERIKVTNDQRPELEILNDEGKNLLL